MNGAIDDGMRTGRWRWPPWRAASPADRSPPLRRLLRSLILLAMLPSALLSLGIIWYGYAQAAARADSETLTAARGLSADIDRYFLGTKSALDALASSPTLAPGQLHLFHAQATEFLAATDRALNVFVLTPSGEQLLNTLAPPGTGLPRLPQDNTGLKRLAEGATLVVSDVYQGPVTQRKMVALAVPKHSATVTYVVAAGVDTTRLTRILEGAQLPKNWTVSVVDSRGVIAARLPRNDDFVGQPATVELTRELDRRDEGFFLGRTKDGTVVRAVFSRAPESRFVVAIGIPEGELLRPLRTALAVVAAILALVLAVALLLADRLSRRIASSASELAAEAVLIGRTPGRGTRRLFFLEADQVRLGLNIATAELQQSAAELDAARAELDVRRATELGALLDAALEPMLVLDDDLVVTAANSPAGELFGRPAAQLIGQHMRALVRPLPGKEWPGAAEALATGGPVPVFVKESVVPTGTSRCLVMAIRRGHGE
jgi:PAS domain-containing protein